MPLILTALFPNAGFLLALGFALFSGLILAVVLGRHFSRSMADVQTVLAAVADGDLSPKPQTRMFEPKEFTELKQAAEKMTERLQFDAEEIKSLVSKCTGDLTSANAELEVLAGALRHAGEAVEIADPEGRYVFVNPAFEVLTGYTAAEAMGRRASDLLGTEEPVEALLTALHGTSGERTFRGDGPGFRKNGTRFEQTVTLAGIATKDNKLKYVVGIRRDITELRRAQEALRVRDRLASVGTLAAGVAHEINNPLTYVIANLSFAVTLMEELKAVQKFSVEMTDFENALLEAQEGAERVKNIVRDLKTFARSDTDSITFLDVNAIIESSLKMVANEIRHAAKLTLSLDAGVPVLGNESKLGQVFINLLVNAVQALPEGKTSANEIHICTSNSDTKVTIEVADTGSGMSEETVLHAFDPFFTTKQVGVGTGLGLCICHNIVTSMGGDIHIDSIETKGTKVVIILPVADVTLLKAGYESPSAEPQRLDRLRILIIDDEEPVGNAFRRILNDCSVDIAVSGADGFKLMQDVEHDVVFCDLMMPDMSGMDLFTRVQNEMPEKLKRVIFMTGGVFTPAAEAFVNQYSQLVVYKPFDSETIRQLVFERVSKLL